MTDSELEWVLSGTDASAYEFSEKTLSVVMESGEERMENAFAVVTPTS